MRSTFLSGILLVCLCGVVILAAPQQQPTTHRLQIERYGIDLTYPDAWSDVSGRYRGLWELRSKALTPSGRPAAYMTVYVEQHRSRAAAIDRLKAIDAEQNDAATFLRIGGWPALQRRYLAPVAVPGQADSSVAAPLVMYVTTAIAMGDRVVRLEGQLAPGANPALASEMETMSRGASFRTQGVPLQSDQELQRLQNSPRLRSNPAQVQNMAAAGDASGAVQKTAVALGSTLAADGSPEPGLTLRLQGTADGVDAEIEAIASTDGRTVIIANNSRDFATSNDGGVTFPITGSAPIPAAGGSGNAPAANGDPSLAYGATGNFYFAYIGFPDGRPANNDSAAQAAQRTCTTSITRSTNNGQSFQFVANATACANNCFPDQEHIAADRFNVSNTGGDQVYSAWRDFSGGGCGGATAIAGPEIPSIVCSSDSGQNWTAKVPVNANGTYSRITVGQDGTVHVVFRQGNNVVLQRFSSCDTGLAPQGGPATIAAGITDVACPVPGLDRCNNGNLLSSHMVAVDDTNPNHVYAAYAVNVAAGNEAVLVQDSTDGGVNWPAARTARLDSGPVGRRFMPWVCATGGTAHVTWYDMRAAFGTPGSGLPNDLADFYGSSASVLNGVLTPGTEYRISEVSDPLCGSGWPGTPRAAGDSESCGVQPQLAGTCTDGAGNTAGRCDFSDCGGAGMNTGGACQCNPGFTCNTGRGVPKYGDYSGNACAAGRLFTAWASATSPPSITPASTDIDVFAFSKIVCCVPQIQVPSAVAFGEVCPGTTSKTLQVCNTGKEDLLVNSITSSNNQFSVAAPSPTFPVTISPDFCFSFQVNFTPTGTGAQSANLTINTNDPVRPALVVPVTATVGTGDLNVSIANTGQFGNVCLGDQADLNIELFNQGKCNLNISSINLLNGANFELPADLQFPLVMSPDSSKDVPIRFKPTGACSDTTPKTDTVVISSDSPGETTLGIDISGLSKCPNLVIDPAPVTGALYSFAPTVVDTTGTLGCFSETSVVVRNTGFCPLQIASMTAGNTNFSVTAPTIFPLTLPVGEETLNVKLRFTPQSGGSPSVPNEILGSLVINSNDPDGAANAALCGEGVQQSGVRVLVTDVTSGTPVPVVGLDRLTLSSSGINSPSPIRITLTNAPVLNANVCGQNVLYHLNHEALPATQTTGSSPRSSYSIDAKEGNLQNTMSFGLGQCQFPRIQLQLLSKPGGNPNN